MNKIVYTFGADPEYALAHNDKGIVSSLDYLPNGKEEKIDLKDGFTFYSDNVLCEATIPPSTSTDEFVNTFKTLVEKTSNYLREIRCRLLAKSAHNFTDEQLSHPVAKTAGCSQEACSWDICIAPTPDLSKTNMRTTGGHLHILRADYKTADDDEFLISPYSRIAAIRALEYYLGTALTFLEKDETAVERKKLYGKSGRHRSGFTLENRSLSNYWTTRPELVSFVDRTARFALDECAKDHEKWLGRNFDFSETKHIIDNGDVEMASRFISNNLPKDLLTEALQLNKLPHSPYLEDNYA